jgi:hypothetical protein
MKKYSTLVFVIAALTVSTPVFAVESFYVGIEAGTGSTELDSSSDLFVPDETSADEEDRVVGVYGGVEITKHVGVELAYDDLGTTSFGYTRTLAPLPPPSPNTSARSEWLSTYESRSISLSLLGRYEFASDFALVGRVGIADYRYDRNSRSWYNGRPVPIHGGGTDSDSFNPVVLGLGVEWRMHHSWVLRLQAQRYIGEEAEGLDGIDHSDVTAITGGIEYRFGIPRTAVQGLQGAGPDNRRKARSSKR